MEKKTTETTLLRSEEASEPLESNVCRWLDVESSLFFALICAGVDLGILGNRNQPSSLQKTQSMVGGWCTIGPKDKGLAKVYTLNCIFKYNSVD